MRDLAHGLVDALEPDPRLVGRRRSILLSKVDDRRPVIEGERHREALVSMGQARTPPREHIDRQDIGAPRSQNVEDRDTSWEAIKAVTHVSAGHGLDLLARPKGFEPPTF